MTEEPQRLARLVMVLVPCTRREAEQAIAEGWVRVDGEVVDVPQFRVAVNQRVEVDSKARQQPVAPVTLLVHKPAGMRMADALALHGAGSRWEADSSRIALRKSHRLGLQALLPLPPQASGLCVFSQEPRIVRKLEHDAALIEQELVAEVSGTIAAGGLERLGRGLAAEGRTLPPARVSWQSETRLRFAVKGIAPDWVPWMCAQVNLELLALKRIRIGSVAMAGIPPGQWRYLAPSEKF